MTSEAYYPGWLAEIDGQPAPIVLTNAAFRGIAIPAGKHRVVMRFAPNIWIGLGITLLALLAAVAVPFRTARVSKRYPINTPRPSRRPQPRQ